MNKIAVLFIGLWLITACNKEKASLRKIDGNWIITSYQEIVYDGTTAFFSLDKGEASFSTSKKAKEGEASISWQALNSTDTSDFTFTGKFKQLAKDEWLLFSNTDTLKINISRQLKKDMTIEMVLYPNRKSIIQLKKI